MYDVHNELFFLLERMKIKKVEKLGANLHDKKECYTHKELKKVLNHGLVLKKYMES